MHKRGIWRRAVSVRPSVCPSVTFLDSVETNKHIFKLFYRQVATLFWFSSFGDHENDFASKTDVSWIAAYDDTVSS